MAPSHRVLMRWTPARLRRRLVLRLARRVVRNSNPASRAVSRLGSETADVEVTDSIFCTVREPVSHPLCGFYASVLTRLFDLFRLEGRAQVVVCRGTGASTCLMKVTLARHDDTN
jgi:predicted hydrocarbon binding protein